MRALSLLRHPYYPSTFMKYTCTLLQSCWTSTKTPDLHSKSIPQKRSFYYIVSPFSFFCNNLDTILIYFSRGNQYLRWINLSLSMKLRSYLFESSLIPESISLSECKLFVKVRLCNWRWQFGHFALIVPSPRSASVRSLFHVFKKSELVRVYYTCSS